MRTNVLEYLEETVQRVPQKVAFTDDTTELTFSDVYRQSRATGSFLHRAGIYKKPVVVFMKRQPKTIAAFLGVICAGCYYVSLDEEMPRDRMKLILESLDKGAMICDEETQTLAKELYDNDAVFLYDEVVSVNVDNTALAEIREHQIDTDPIYIVFTSGSTGIPKGVIACHRSVLDYVEHLCEVLKFNEDTIFGNQAPLYFDACLKEIYPTLKYGATTYLIPKPLFMFPVKLVEYLNEHRINTVCWAVPALTMISSFSTFDKVKPEYLHTIAFASEVFPIRQFNLWRKTLPNARFINLYGPTEITGICCYYEIDREFGLEESLPIGRPFRNTEIILLDEENKIPACGEQGEICVRGTCLTLGYYRNPEKTAEAFVQNPLNDLYPECIYRTGDLGKYNERGELMFLGRKDDQIKHMGHRIELREIETVVNQLVEVQSACCLYDREKEKIILYYVGDISVKDMTAYIKGKLPRYMVPNIIHCLQAMPLTPNEKINRKLLMEQYKQK